jgi:hypothetical protein
MPIAFMSLHNLFYIDVLLLVLFLRIESFQNSNLFCI